VADPAFTGSFLRRIVELEKLATRAELQLLDTTLARIVNDPHLSGRFATFYDPALPTFFLRAAPFLIEFAVEERSDRVTFISLFYQP
jgi:hypothetical protein